MTITMYFKQKNCNVDVYQFFENRTALVYDPHQAAQSKGNGWQIVSTKNLIPLDYLTEDMKFESKTTKNKIKKRLTLSQAIWTCTDGTDFENCNEAIAYERKLMEAEHEKEII